MNAAPDCVESKPHPYAALTPDVVLQALEQAGFWPDGRLLALNSYENRVYLAYLEDGASVVVKFYRPQRWSDAQILEEHRYIAELRADEVPAVRPWDLPLNLDRGEPLPPVDAFDPRAGDLSHPLVDDALAAASADAPKVQTLARLQVGDVEFRFAVFPRCGGRAPDLDHAETLMRIGQYLGRIHASGSHRRFEHRLTLTVATWGEQSRDWLLASGMIPADVRPAYQQVVNELLILARDRFEQVADLPTLRLHGDCHPGNVLWLDGPHFVDFDDACNGPAIQDLWMLLSGNRAEMTRQLHQILEGYEEFVEFDARSTVLIEPLRALRQIHYAAWLARRWDDPAFAQTFSWFAQPAWWGSHVNALREQIMMIEQPPLVA